MTADRFAHCPHRLIAQDRDCKSSFGPGTEEDVEQRLAEHVAKWHPEELAGIAENQAEQARATLALCRKHSIRDADEYLAARMAVREARELLSIYHQKGAKAFAKAIRLTLETIAVIALSLVEYEDRDPAKCFNDLVASIPRASFTKPVQQ